MGPTYLDPNILLTVSKLSSILAIRSSLLPRIIYFPSLKGIVTMLTLFHRASTLDNISVSSAYFAA